MTEQTSYDIIIIGFGVSGLSLASVLGNNAKTLIIESGKPYDQRNHDDPVEALIGTGGAGLFSDGKFSLYPSATKVWQLENKNLQMACDNLNVSLKDYDVNITFDEYPETKISDDWILKQYPSYYINLENRLEIIKNLVKKTNADIFYQHIVTEIIKKDDHYEIKIKNLKTEQIITVTTKYVVLAGGRFSPLYFKDLSNIFRRVEYGARVVSSDTTKDMIQEGITDPKFKLEKTEYSAKTFCWCKEGSYVLTDNLQGIKTYSGRADDENAKVLKQTNFGLNVIIHNEQENHIDKLLKISPFKIKLEDITESKLQEIMGIKYGKYFHETFELLLKQFPSLKNDNTFLVGPTIEGVGYYPNINEQTLQIKNENIFCCGDASGIFRGIIAGMISGFFVGHKLNECFNKKL